MFASSVAPVTILGAPDLLLLTLIEFDKQIRWSCWASGLRLIADADHGFGNSLGLMSTVRTPEIAALSACTGSPAVLLDLDRI